MSSTHTLNVTMQGDREIVVSRDFDAPRRMVWDAMTRPELLRRWLFGPTGWTMTACEEDVRPGGTFNYAWVGPDGTEMKMHGVYREVVPAERAVRTETFSVGCDFQSGEQLGTAVLTEDEGRTLLTVTVLYPSKEARDGAIQSGMTHGMEAGYNRLDDVLAAELEQKAG
jgi:uncharacterized protein YndB with AHSA1/START domain